MRNRYAGTCYRCGRFVGKGEGHFERFEGGWRTQHAGCAIRYRGTLDPAREALKLDRMKRNAAGTGKRAQRARKALRELDATNRPIDYTEF